MKSVKDGNGLTGTTQQQLFQSNYVTNCQKVSTFASKDKATTGLFGASVSNHLQELQKIENLHFSLQGKSSPKNGKQQVSDHLH